MLCAFAVTPVLGFTQLPDGLKFDDGFTWVECHNFEVSENSTVNGYWTPEVSFRIWGKVPDRSGFKIQLKQNGKTVSEYLTDGYPVKLAGGPTQGMLIVGFWKDTGKTAASGPMNLDVTYIDGATNKEYLAKSLKLDVRKVPQTRAFVGKRDPYASAFFINRHSEILSNILYFRDVEFPSYTQWSSLSYYSERRVELLLNYSENADFAGPGQGRITVEVNGKPLDLKVPGNEMIQDNIGFGELAGKYNVEHSDRDAEQYFKSGTPYKERIGFARRSMLMPFQWGPPLVGRPKDSIFTTDHPGDWKVTYIVDRKPVRIFRFKIGENGLPLPHPEQQAGLVLAPNAVLVDTEIPGDGGVFDGRLTAEFAKAGAFFGRPWATEGMRAAAAKVPTKGRPFPVSSASKG